MLTKSPELPIFKTLNFFGHFNQVNQGYFMHFSVILLIFISSLGFSSDSDEPTCHQSVKNQQPDFQENFENNADYMMLYDDFLSKFPWAIKLRSRHVEAHSNEVGASNFFVDLSGGTGLVAKDLLDKNSNINVHLVDISEDMLGVAKQKQKSHPSLNLHLSDVRDIKIEGNPIETNSVDGITWNMGAYFLNPSEFKAVLRNSLRMLKPGKSISIGNMRKLNPEEKKTAFDNGKKVLGEMIMSGIITEKQAEIVIKRTEDSENIPDSTRISAADMGKIATDLGFSVIQADNHAYGGLGVFVVLTK